MVSVIPMCSTMTASPDTIHAPSGKSQICVQVKCGDATGISVRYRIPDASAKFCDGSIDVGPFDHDCDAGMNQICRELCFNVSAGLATFPVDIVVMEKGALSGLHCSVNLSVSA
jgi:hypothetical protein